MSNWLEDKMSSWHNSISGLTQLANNTTGESDSNIVDAVESLIAGYGGGGSLPEGFEAIKTGEFTIDSDVSGANTHIFNHNLGVVPDLLIVWSNVNFTITYSMLGVLHIPNVFGIYRSNYKSVCWAHGNSTSSVACTNTTGSYGVKGMTETTATISPSTTSFTWRAGTYKFIAIKFT